MSVKVRLILITVILVLMAVGVSTAIGINFIQTEAQRQLDRFVADEREAVAAALKNQVDLAHSVVQQGYSQATQFDFQKQTYGRVLQGVLTVLIDDIGRKIERVASGEMTLDDAQKRVISVIQQLRFGSEDDYIWIQTDELPVPHMVMHPLRPDLAGKLLDNPGFDCARNRADNLFVAAVDVASSGGGFVDYLWERRMANGVRMPNIPKIAYVRHVPEWHWILGSGVFVDDAVRQATGRLKEHIAALRYDNGNGYFFVHDSRGVIVVHPQPDLINRKAGDDNRTAFVKNSLDVLKSTTGVGFFEFQVATGTPDAGRHLGYVRFFEPLGWALGTSCNLDTLRKGHEWRGADARGIIGRVLLWNLLPLLILGALTVRLVGRTVGDATPAASLRADSAPVSQVPGPGDVAEAAVGAQSAPAGGDKAADTVIEVLRFAREVEAERAAEQVRLLTAIHQSIEKLAQRSDPDDHRPSTHKKG